MNCRPSDNIILKSITQSYERTKTLTEENKKHPPGWVKEVSMTLETIWAVLAPYIEQLITLLVSSGLLTAISTIIFKKLSKKVDNVHIAENVSEAVVNKIVTKDLKVSLETANKKQINQIKEDILSQFNSVFTTVQNQTALLAAMAQVMIRFKAATPEEKEEIINASRSIKGTNVKHKKEEPIIVTINPIESKETESTDLDLF